MVTEDVTYAFCHALISFIMNFIISAIIDPLVGEIIPLVKSMSVVFPIHSPPIQIKSFLF